MQSAHRALQRASKLELHHAHSTLVNPGVHWRAVRSNYHEVHPNVPGDRHQLLAQSFAGSICGIDVCDEGSLGHGQHGVVVHSLVHIGGSCDLSGGRSSTLSRYSNLKYDILHQNKNKNSQICFKYFQNIEFLPSLSLFSSPVSYTSCHQNKVL